METATATARRMAITAKTAALKVPETVAAITKATAAGAAEILIVTAAPRSTEKEVAIMVTTATERQQLQH